MSQTTDTTAARGPLPTFFKGWIRTAQDDPKSGYADVGYQLAGHLATLVDSDSDDEHAAKLAALSALMCGPGRYVRGVEGFLASPDAAAVIAWLEREIP